MKKIVFIFVCLVALVTIIQPGIAVASVECQPIQKFCCTNDGCDPCGWCLFCRIVNPDGSDGGFITDC